MMDIEVNKRTLINEEEEIKLNRKSKAFYILLWNNFPTGFTISL